MTAPSNTARRTFGVELERNLRARGWSISEAARRSGISAENLRAMFLGRHVPAPNDWSNMCHKLGVSSVVQHWRAAEAEALEEGERTAPVTAATVPEALHEHRPGAQRVRARIPGADSPRSDVEAAMIAFAYKLLKERPDTRANAVYAAVFDRFGHALTGGAMTAIRTRVGLRARPGRPVTREQTARDHSTTHALAMKVIDSIDADTAPAAIAASAPPSAKRRIVPRAVAPAPSVAPLEQAIASLVAATPGLQGLSITIGEDGTARVDYSIKASLTVGPARNTPTPSGADLT